VHAHYDFSHVRRPSEASRPKRPDSMTFHVFWSPQDQEYVGVCKEIPGLSWLARSEQAALRGIRLAALDAGGILAAEAQHSPPGRRAR
jgi:hypothetical protein